MPLGSLVAAAPARHPASPGLGRLCLVTRSLTTQPSLLPFLKAKGGGSCATREVGRQKIDSRLSSVPFRGVGCAGWGGWRLRGGFLPQERVSPTPIATPTTRGRRNLCRNAKPVSMSVPLLPCTASTPPPPSTTCHLFAPHSTPPIPNSGVACTPRRAPLRAWSSMLLGGVQAELSVEEHRRQSTCTHKTLSFPPPPSPSLVHSPRGHPLSSLLLHQYPVAAAPRPPAHGRHPQPDHRQARLNACLPDGLRRRRRRCRPRRR